MKILAWLVTVVSGVYGCLGVWFLATSAGVGRNWAALQASGVEAAGDLDALQLERAMAGNGSLAVGLGALGLVAGIGLLRRKPWAPPLFLALSYFLVLLAVYFWVVGRTRDQAIQVGMAISLAIFVAWLVSRRQSVA